MGRSLREINANLLQELRGEREGTRATDSWPFALAEVGTARGAVGPVRVLAFDDGERKFVLDGLALQVLPAAGMGLADLQAELDGVAWITQRQPVSLTTSMPGVPPAEERRQAVERLAAAAGLGAPVVREGVYLRKAQVYLAIVDGGGRTCAVGTGLPAVEAPFPEAAPRRRLGVAVGRWIARKAS